MNETWAKILEERRELSIDRISQIPGEDITPEPFRTYFKKTAEFLLQMDAVRRELAADSAGRKNVDPQALKQRIQAMYEDILPENYSRSYADPAFAQEQLGETLGRALSFLYVQLRGIIAWNYEGAPEETVLHQELFLEVYQMFCQEVPSYHRLQQVLYWFLCDNCDILITERIRRMLDPAEPSLAGKIIQEADLADPCYLYLYGAYISEADLARAARMNSLDEAEIERMARSCLDTFSADYHGAALQEQRTVRIHFQLGQERLVRCLSGLLQTEGFQPLFCRAAQSAVNRCSAALLHIGYGAGSPDPRYESDHQEDGVLFLDRRFATRNLTVLRKTFEMYQSQADAYVGIIDLSSEGPEPTLLPTGEKSYKLSDRQQETLNWIKSQSEAICKTALRGARTYRIAASDLTEGTR